MFRSSRQSRLYRPLLLAAALAAAAPAGRAGGAIRVAQAPPAQDRAARLVAVGDVHGAIDELRALLHEVGLIDVEGNWSGGDDVLVQTGDFVDRGVGVRDVMELLIRLQGQAREAGGEVVVLLGNHEIMDLVGALRDVAPESLAAFAGRDAEARRREAFQDYERRVLRRDPDWRRATPEARRAAEEKWIAEHPPGWVEYLEALGPEGSFGRWLRALPAIHRRGDLLFMHAGISPALAGWSPDRIDARVHDEIAAFDRYRERLREEGRLPAVADLQDTLAAAAGRVGDLAGLAQLLPEDGAPPLPGADVDPDEDARSFYAPLARLDRWFLFAPEGPMWFRGYARWDYFEIREQLPPILTMLGARTLVVGHTPQIGGIRVRADGGLYLIDTGMLRAAYGGHGEALVLAGERAIAVTATGQRRELPAPRAMVGPAARSRR